MPQNISPTHKPIMIVGEAWGEAEESKGQAFAGPSGGVLRSVLYQAGIATEECYFTNVINFRPKGNRIDSLYVGKTEGLAGYRPVLAGKYLPESVRPELDRLQAEIERVRPNIIVAAGNLALWALCKKSGIKRYRGSPLPTHDTNYKVLPTWNPASILRQWELRVILLADFTKVKREMRTPELNRPVRYIYLEPNIQDIWDFYNEYLINEPYLSCDIETKGKQITEVGYGTADGKRAIVIPFWSRKHADGNYWPDTETELEAWSIVRHINSKHRLLGQNFSYDMQYFWRTIRIPCPQFEGDTMLMHHSLQPEMEKGLGFLGSIYTDEPSWKFMRQDHTEHFKKGED